MDEGLGESQDVSETEPPPYKNTSLEEEVYSKKYIELNGFLQNINPEVKSSRDLERNIRTYFEIGKIAKDGLEKASEIYNKDSEPFNESLYLLEKGQIPTLLHKYAESLDRFNKNYVKDMLKDFENNVQLIAFKYRGQIKRRLKLSHFESLDYVLKDLRKKGKMNEINTRSDVLEALMLAQKLGTKIKIHHWYRKLVDNKKVGSVVIAFFNRYYKESKIEVYNKIKDELSEKFGMKMGRLTFYGYVAENKEPITMQPTIEPDISEIRSNVG